MSRWAAAPALIVALLGLVAIFVTIIVTRTDPGWQKTTALIGFGLAAVATLMILIEGQGTECESSSSEQGAAGG
jgi:hypothetical protein